MYVACTALVWVSRSEPHTTEFYAFLGILYIIIITSVDAGASLGAS